MPSLRRLAATVLAVSALLAAPAAAATTTGPGVDVLAVRSTSDEAVSLVAAVHPAPSAPLTSADVRVSAGASPLPTSVAPVISDEAAIGLVLDASADGAPSLRQGGLSGATNLLLQLPTTSRTSVVADHDPPTVVAPGSTGVTDAVSAVSDLHSGGRRATSEALTLALRQFPTGSAHPVLVLLTAAPDAGGEAAAALGARLRRAHAVLAVVSTAGGSTFWPTAATATGGVAIQSPPGGAIAAFDTVAAELKSRYLVTFSRPVGAAAATLRLKVAGTPVAVTVAIPPVDSDADSGGGPGPGVLVRGLVAGAGLVVVIGAVLAVRARRRRATQHGPTAGDPTGDVPGPASVEEDVTTTAGAPDVRPVRSVVPGKRLPPEERVLAHRERAWAAELPDVDPALLRWTAAAATLAGASTPQEAHALLALLPSLDGADPRPLRGRLIGWWAGAVPGAGLLNPLLPERLGDHLVATTLTDSGGPQASAAVILDGLVRLPSAGQLAAALVVLARARIRYPDLAEPVDAMVLREVVPLARRASGDAASDPGHRGDPTSPGPGCAVGDGVLRLLTEPLRARLVAPGGGPPGHRDHQRDHHRDVASACRQLADVATGIGRVDDAADLLDVALRIDRALTGAMPREMEAALRGHVEALGRLVDQDPQNPTLRRQIAGALARLAQLDREEGRLALADAGYRRALEALAELLALDPENLEYRREVAAAHVRLAAMDAAAGWTAQAEAGYRRARELDDRSPRPSDRNSPYGG